MLESRCLHLLSLLITVALWGTLLGGCTPRNYPQEAQLLEREDPNRSASLYERGFRESTERDTREEISRRMILIYESQLAGDRECSKFLNLPNESVDLGSCDIVLSKAIQRHLRIFPGEDRDLSWSLELLSIDASPESAALVSSNWISLMEGPPDGLWEKPEAMVLLQKLFVINPPEISLELATKTLGRASEPLSGESSRLISVVEDTRAKIEVLFCPSLQISLPWAPNSACNQTHLDEAAKQWREGHYAHATQILDPLLDHLEAEDPLRPKTEEVGALVYRRLFHKTGEEGACPFPDQLESPAPLPSACVRHLSAAERYVSLKNDPGARLQVIRTMLHLGLPERAAILLLPSLENNAKLSEKQQLTGKLLDLLLRQQKHTQAIDIVGLLQGKILFLEHDKQAHMGTLQGRLNRLKFSLPMHLCEAREGAKEWPQAAQCFEDLKATQELYNDELLWRAARAWGEGGEREKSAKAFLEITKQYPQSDLAADALFIAASTFGKLGNTLAQVEALEQFGEQFKQEKNASECLIIAATIRQERGETEQAIQNLQAHLSLFPHAQNSSAILLDIASLYAKNSQCPEVIDFLEQDSSLALIKTSPVDALLALGMTMRCHHTSSSKKKLISVLAAIQTRAETPSASKLFEDLTSARTQKLRHMLAEAQFLRGELAYGEVAKISFADKKDPEKLQTRLDERMLKIKAASEVYSMVFSKYQDARWGLLSICRIGMMSQDFAAEMRKIPPMPAMSPEVAERFNLEIDKLAKGFEGKALSTFEAALQKAEELEISHPIIEESKARFSVLFKAKRASDSQ